MMTSTRALGCVAAALALLAAFAGAGPAPTAHGEPEQRDDITAIELAQWIRDRRGVVVLDLRSDLDFRELAIPTATRASSTELPQLTFAATDTVVVYGDGEAEVAAAARALESRGVERVYFLRGGIYAWLTDVLTPALPEQATPAQETAFARVAELSRYFGGVPRRGEPDAEPPAAAASGTVAQQTGAADAVRRIRRRGC